VQTMALTCDARVVRNMIGAENRRFRNLSVSLITALEHEDSAKVIGISCRDALSVWVGFRACFSRRVRYRLVWAFSIPVDSPRDKRGIVWSGNRGLRFGIGADYG